MKRQKTRLVVDLAAHSEESHGHAIRSRVRFFSGSFTVVLGVLKLFEAEGIVTEDEGVD